MDMDRVEKMELKPIMKAVSRKETDENRRMSLNGRGYVK